jgi:hypothetical protein
MTYNHDHVPNLSVLQPTHNHPMLLEALLFQAIERAKTEVNQKI